MKQFKLPLSVGAIYQNWSVVSMGLSVVSFAMIAWGYYDRNQLAQSIFKSYYIFMAVITIGVIIALYLSHVVFIPTIYAYSNSEANKPGRNPQYELLIELKKDVEEIKNRK